MPEALQPIHSQVGLMRSGEFGGHSSFAFKSVQLALVKVKIHSVAALKFCITLSNLEIIEKKL